MKKIFLMLSLVIALGFQSFAQNNNVKEDKEKGEYEIITENRSLMERIYAPLQYMMLKSF